MSNDLLHCLLRGSVASPGPAWSEDARTVLEAASPADWSRSLTMAEQHRLLPLMSSTLAANGLEEPVPAAALHRLRDAHRKTLLTNSVHLLAVDRVLAAMRDRGVEPMFWKGVVLIDRFYPDPAARWMGDIDLWVDAGDLEPMTEAFRAVGFAPASVETEDAIYFANRMGVMFDVHHRVRLFRHLEMRDLAIDLETRRLQTPTIRVLEPNAMLVHLAVHLEGHAKQMGYLLSWLLDVAFVVKEWGDAFEPERLFALMREPNHWVCLLRTLRFLRDDLGVTLPAALDERAGRVPALTLDRILRQRRLAEWGLPGARGWARVGASRLTGWPPARGRPFPGLRDLVLWPADRLGDRRVRRGRVVPGAGAGDVSA